MLVLRLLPVLIVLLLGIAPAASAHHRTPKAKVIATGLDSPRHLAFGPWGDLYVAEAGRGGTGPCFFAAGAPQCMGDSGAVTRIDPWGRQSRFVEGLASFADAPGLTNGIGPHGIEVDRRGTVYVTNGGPTAPRTALAPAGVPITREQLAAQNPVADLFGRLLKVTHRGMVRSVADIYDFERDVNPDAEVGSAAIDSNAVDVLIDHRRFVVADAGGNALDVVHRHGRVSALAVFANREVPNPFGGPPVAMQSVPTGVVKGWDRFYYMSELTGFPFLPGGANIYRVHPRTGAATVWASGFTNLMDLAVGRHGELYALSIDADGFLNPGTDGAIWRVDRHGRAKLIELPAGTLTAPGGIVVGRHGTLYVTNNGDSPGGGEVLRIRLR